LVGISCCGCWVGIVSWDLSISFRCNLIRGLWDDVTAMFGLGFSFNAVFLRCSGVWFFVILAFFGVYNVPLVLVDNLHFGSKRARGESDEGVRLSP